MTTDVTQPANYAQRMRDSAGTADPTRLPHTHHCGARWAGSTTAHCGVCCTTFNGISTFDRHRRGGVCTPPAEVGMSLIPGRAYDVWGYPAEVTP